MATIIDEKTLKALQQKSFEMATYFAALCKEHDLLCYFCGGGCIGALRHNGFIPWDDDLDFFMPRPDYERLIKIFDEINTKENYSLQYSTAQLDTRNQFATLCDENTTYIKDYMADLDINQGLSLDIIPLDGRPPEGALYGIRRKIQMFWALVYSLCIIGKAPTNHGGAVQALGSFFLLFFRSYRARYKMFRYAERKMSKYPFYSASYIAELTTGPVYMKRDYPGDIFKSASYHEFEGVVMPLPADPDAYLKMAFGDYMTLPDEDSRVPHHDFTFIDMDTPYREYRGVHYCKEDAL